MIALYHAGSADFEDILAHRLLAGTDAADQKIDAAVDKIIAAVRRNGDRALVEMISKFENRRVKPAQVRLAAVEIRRLCVQVPKPVQVALRKAYKNIEIYHREQLRCSSRDFMLKQKGGSLVGQQVRPLGRVGLYVPGGKAAYPSSVLMNAVPARVAGVSALALFTPAAPGSRTPDPAVVFAANLCGIDEIYVCGGAHAIAAAAYGTELIPAVDKIVGPGNAYVASAKKKVFGQVEIDMIAGPSEVLVVADESADPEWIAWDLLAQAEHDERARPLCICLSESVAQAVKACLALAVAEMPRREIAKKACREHGALIVADLKQAVALVDRLAPEHLEVQVKNPWAFLKRVRHFGAAFVGPHTPEAIGDYWAGPSHVLPTAGTARFASPLGVEDFLKRSSVLCYSAASLKKAAADVAVLADAEGLTAHRKSVQKRFERE